jgi:hypothetical protein
MSSKYACLPPPTVCPMFPRGGGFRWQVHNKVVATTCMYISLLHSFTLTLHSVQCMLSQNGLQVIFDHYFSIFVFRGCNHTEEMFWCRQGALQGKVTDIRQAWNCKYLIQQGVICKYANITIWYVRFKATICVITVIIHFAGMVWTITLLPAG